MVVLKNISYRYPTSKDKVLKNIDLNFEKGKFYTVIGKNGSGKTTLCNLIRGFIPHFFKGELTGEICIDGIKLTEENFDNISNKIGFVFQNPFVQISGVTETVYEELAYGLENMGCKEDYIHERVNYVLDLLKIRYLENKNPNNLSGGQKQRIALASTIAMDPEILVIDEPTSQLDPDGTNQIFEIIKILKDLKKTIILVEHKMELIAEYSDYVILLNDGKVIMQGETKDILSNIEIENYGVGVPKYAKIFHILRKKGIEIPGGNIPIKKVEAYEMLKIMEEKYGFYRG